MSEYKIIDGHQDIAFNAFHVTGKNFLNENRLDESSLLPEPQLNQSDYIRLMNSGVKVVFGVCFPYRLENGDAYSDFEIGQQEMLKQLNFYNDLAGKSKGKVQIIKSKSDLNFVLENQGVLGLIILAEDAIGISRDLSNLRSYQDKGLSMIGPVWNRDNQFGGGTDSKNGITEAGKLLLLEMEKLGIILDTAHMNENLFKDAMEVFKGKVMNSHTCVSYLNPHRRNLNDSQLREVANRRGVLGIAFVPEFLREKASEATIDDVVSHIKHAVEVCGIDSIGLGSDFDGMSWPEYVPDISHTGEYHILVQKLKKVFSEQEVEKIIYLNWKKFLENSLP